MWDSIVAVRLTEIVLVVRYERKPSALWDSRPYTISVGLSKYPPAEPGALGLLAPQRGLTAILTTKTPRQDMYSLNFKCLQDSLANFVN